MTPLPSLIRTPQRTSQRRPGELKSLAGTARTSPIDDTGYSRKSSSHYEVDNYDDNSDNYDMSSSYCDDNSLLSSRRSAKPVGFERDNKKKKQLQRRRQNGGNNLHSNPHSNLHSNLHSNSTPALPAISGVPEVEDAASKAESRLEQANFRERAKKAEFSRTAVEMMKLREAERSFYTESQEAAVQVRKKRHTKGLKLKKLRGAAGNVGTADKKKGVPPTFVEISKTSMLAQANTFDDDSVAGRYDYGDGSGGGDDLSMGETSLGGGGGGGSSVGSLADSVGSLGDASLSSLAASVGSISVVTVMSHTRTNSNVTIAKAIERFNKRKRAYERKQGKAARAEAALLAKIMEVSLLLGGRGGEGRSFVACSNFYPPLPLSLTMSCFISFSPSFFVLSFSKLQTFIFICKLPSPFSPPSTKTARGTACYSPRRS